MPKRDEYYFLSDEEKDKAEPLVSVTLFPNWKPKNERERDVKKFDIIRLDLKNSCGEKTRLLMTPDEALEISAFLNRAVYYYLIQGNGEFKRKFIKAKKEFVEKYAHH